MKLRVIMLLAGLCTGTLSGQVPQAAPAAGTGRTAPAGTVPAGVTNTQAGTSGSVQSAGTSVQQSSVPNSQNGPSGAHHGVHHRGSHPRGSAAHKNTQPPAADGDSRIVITGYPSYNTKGTADRPLLPIASIGNALGIPSGTPIRVRLTKTVDSGHAHNGEMVQGTLDAPIGNLPVGTPVQLTVVQSARAGTIASYGELSLQVVSIADKRVLSDTITAIGKQGAKELPDAAPGRGTEAVFSPDQPISLPTA